MIKADAVNPVKDLLETLHSASGVKTETIFTVLTTLFVFSAGIFSNWVINRLKDRRQRNSYQKTINLLLRSLSDVCKNQYKATSKDLETVDLLDIKKAGISQHVYAALHFLNKMDYSLFIRYYVQGCKKDLKTKAVTKVFQIIGFANIFETDNEEKVKFFMDSIKPLQETYIKHMLTLESFEQALLTLEVIDYDFKQGLIALFSDWGIKHTDNSFRNSFTNLISPLMRLLDKYPLESATVKLTPLTKECHFAYSEIAHTSERLREHLKAFAHSNRRVYKQLDVILLIFNYKQNHR